MPGSPHGVGHERRRALDMARIFERHGAEYRERYRPDEDQRRVLCALTRCRTARLGGHIDVCRACGDQRPSYNSCRNRHCPKCQSLAQAAWLEGRKRRLLPVHYFHVVFTLPAQLRGLWMKNPRVCFDLLFASASATLLDLAKDPARLGATPGITAVLHTWTRKLEYHPHVHCIVTGGGLSPDQTRWVAARKRHLFPVRVMSALFRGKLLDGLRRAHAGAKLRLPQTLSTPGAFERLVDHLYRRDWVVYAKRPFGNVEHVYEYLGRYTHRVGLSNHRLRAIDDTGVTFFTRHRKTLTLPPLELVRRFLLHVLPAGYTKMRHYGLVAASNATTRLALARHHLGAPPMPAAPDDTDWRDRFLALTGIDLRICSRCHSPRITRTPMLRAPTSRVDPNPAELDTS
jgi:Putative transposase/Transposase zinc-binding domain